MLIMTENRANIWITLILLTAFCLTGCSKQPIKNGTELIYKADLSEKDPSQTDAQVMTDIKSVVESRLHSLGMSNAVVQILANSEIQVKIPEVKNSSEVISLIGQQGLLRFKEEQLDSHGNLLDDTNGNPIWIPAMATGSNGVKAELTGKYLEHNTYVETDSSGNAEVAFEWNTEGTNLFKQITAATLNKRLGIFLDNELISAPTVQAIITNRGVINGVTIDEARTLVVLLNSNSLDVPLIIMEQNDFSS